MTAIFKRELKAYFNTPIAAIYLGVFYLFAGVFLYFGCLVVSYADISGLFMSMFSVVMYILPVLTMRLFTEDRKYKTDQLLLTAPVSNWDIVMGKYLAAFVLFLMACAILLVYCVLFSFYTVGLDWGLIASNFLGLLLLGAALIAIGTFLSSVTENQIISVILTFCVTLFLSMADAIASVMPWVWLKETFAALSFAQRYNNFSRGLVGLSGVVFFASVTVLFLFYTARSIDRRRYLD